jgi:hypothetical protein
MANDYTPEEIQRIAKDMADAQKEGKAVTQEMADAFKDAQKGVKGYAAAQRNLFTTLGKSVADVTKAMYKGEQGAAGMASSVESVTTALTAFTFLLGGPVIKALSLAAMGLFKFGKVAAEQSDQLFKTYQDLAKTGAGASEGMRGIFDNMQKFGYGLEQLDQMTALIRENSKTLSSFGGTVLNGTKIFADNMAGIQRSDIGRQFQRMGYTVDDINKYGAGYVKLQQMLGQTQSGIQRNLTAGTVAYMKELDQLARITGDTREAQEAKLAAAMAEDAFAATMDDLAERARSGDAQAEAQLKKMRILAQVLPDEIKQEYVKAVGGDVAAAQKLLMVAPNAYQAMIDSTSSASDVMQNFAKESKGFQKGFQGLYQFNAVGDAAFRYATIQEAQAKYGEILLMEQMSAAELEQKVIDQSTKNAADLRINQQQGRDALQSFVNMGVKPATAALESLTGAAAGAAKLAPGSVANGEAMGGGSANFFSAVRKFFGGSGTNKGLLDIIGQAESGGNYNALVYGKNGANVAKSADLTNMTIAEVMEYQKGMIAAGHASTAVGKYQMIANTLKEQVAKAGLDPTKTKFDAKTQDLLAQQLINQAGVGKVDPATAMRNLAGTWASLPADMTGRGRYDGVNGNKSLADPRQLLAAISGPSGGYNNTMNGVRPGETLPAQQTSPQAAPGSTVSDSEALIAGVMQAVTKQTRVLEDVRDYSRMTAQQS